MSEKIVQLNEEVIKGQLKELLEQEAEKLTQAAPGMSEMRLARGTAVVTTAETLPPPPAMLRSMCPA